MYRKGEQEYSPGNRYIGSVPLIDLPDEPGYGAIRALNPKTGDRIWEYKLLTKPWAGVLTTAGKLLFGGSDEGYFFALDARNGTLLWKVALGGQVNSGPMSYAVKAGSTSRSLPGSRCLRSRCGSRRGRTMATKEVGRNVAYRPRYARAVCT